MNSSNDCYYVTGHHFCNVTVTWTPRVSKIGASMQLPAAHENKATAMKTRGNLCRSSKIYITIEITQLQLIVCSLFASFAHTKMK